MYPYQKKKKYPSQIKYEENNPTITFRMKKHEKDIIREMSKKFEKSISQLVRESLLEARKEYSDAYDKGHLDGFKEGSVEWASWFYCSKCGEKIFIKPNSNVHKIIIGYMKEHHWVHAECDEH